MHYYTFRFGFWLAVPSHYEYRKVIDISEDSEQTMFNKGDIRRKRKHLPDQAAVLIEKYDDSVANLFRRATRFHAEGKMAFYSSVSLIVFLLASLLVSPKGIPSLFSTIVVLLMILLPFLVGLQRQTRRAYEVLFGVDYLSKKEEALEDSENLRQEIISQLLK